MNTDLEYDDFNITNINSIINFIKENTIQIFLLLLVPVIIYIVDHISNINAMIFGLQSPVPGLASSSQNEPPKNQKIQDKKVKKHRHIKK